MWPQQAIAVYSQGAGVRRRGSGPRGFSAFATLGDDAPLVAAPTDFGADDTLTISAQPMNATELRNRIRNQGGAIVVSAEESQGALNVAYGSSWQFSVEKQTDGRYKITERNWTQWALIAGLGVGAVVLVKVFRG